MDADVVIVGFRFVSVAPVTAGFGQKNRIGTRPVRAGAHPRTRAAIVRGRQGRVRVPCGIRRAATGSRTRSPSMMVSGRIRDLCRCQVVGVRPARGSIQKDVAVDDIAQKRGRKGGSRAVSLGQM